MWHSHQYFMILLLLSRGSYFIRRKKYERIHHESYCRVIELAIDSIFLHITESCFCIGCVESVGKHQLPRSNLDVLIPYEALTPDKTMKLTHPGNNLRKHKWLNVTTSTGIGHRTCLQSKMLVLHRFIHKHADSIFLKSLIWSWKYCHLTLACLSVAQTKGKEYNWKSSK